MLPIRLLLLVTQSDNGGAQKYVYSLATGLPRDRYDVTVACGGNGPLIDKLQRKAIRVVRIPALTPDMVPSIKDLLAFEEIFSFLRQSSFHIVHTNSTKAGFLGRVAAKIAGVPIIVFTAHGFVLNERLSLIWRLLFAGVEFSAGRISDVIITVSEKDRETGLKYRIAPPEKIITIYNGIDVGDLGRTWNENNKREQLGLKDSGILVGTVANLYRTKGLPYLLYAARIVADEYPDIHFIIIGDGNERAELLELSRKLKLDQTVLLLGQRNDVPEILPLLDIFVLPSIKEGLPFALLEAMAIGKPVVATTVGGILEIISSGKNGILVPPGNPQALARAITDLILDPGTASRIGVAGRETILQNFTMARMIRQTRDIYEELVRQKLGCGKG